VENAYLALLHATQDRGSEVLLIDEVNTQELPLFKQAREAIEQILMELNKDN